MDGRKEAREEVMMADSEMRVGDRCSVSSRHGSIRYIGPVEGQNGNWVGVEWDDAEGGKHNGTVKGKQYFTTRYPKNGSLVKESLIETGNDLLEEIKERYNAQCSIEEEKISTKEVEFVGMEKTQQKQSDIYSLVFIVLDSRLVSRPPPLNSREFPACKELNLYNNLLHRWEDIHQILTFFPHLHELVLRRNRMDSMDCVEGVSPWKEVSPTLANLILSDCGVSSKTISTVLSWLPSVSHLYALRNDLPSFSPSIDVASRLVVLDLEDNPIHSFANIHGVFHSLTKLSLNNCGMTSIDLPDEKCRFPALETLNLLKNDIKEWSSISHLQSLPSLSTLYIGTKLFQVEAGIAVHEVMIAKLSSLVDLNRFDVNEVERRSAEVRFINKYAKCEKRTEHKPDLDRLIKIHGPPAVDTAKHGLSVLPIRIVFGEKSLERKIPLSLTVLRLTEMLCRLFRVRDGVRLELCQNEQIVLLDNPMRPFDHYSPESSSILRLVVDQ